MGVLALKVALALTLAGHPLLQPEGELDAGEYWRLAQRVVGGDVLLTGTPFYVSPLYIYWLAFAQAMTGRQRLRACSCCRPRSARWPCG